MFKGRTSQTPVAARRQDSVTYSFRIRFLANPRSRLDISEAEVTLAFREAPPPTEVRLSSNDADIEIREADWLSLTCDGFDTEVDARVGALECRSRLMTVLAALSIGADFGDRAPGSGFTEAGLQFFEKKVGQRVVHNKHGTTIYLTEPKPKFISMAVAPVVRPSREQFDTTMTRAIEMSSQLSELEALAYDLYSASFFTNEEDARLVALMMSLETLMKQESESDRVVECLSDLVDHVSQYDLPEDEAHRLKSRIGHLKTKSIGQAGRSLVSVLAPRRYMGLDPEAFFTRCYDIRSKLVHGEVPRPTRADVGQHAAPLQRMVGDLLAGQLAREQ